jgi:hypothetical protein
MKQRGTELSDLQLANRVIREHQGPEFEMDAEVRASLWCLWFRDCAEHDRLAIAWTGKNGEELHTVYKRALESKRAALEKLTMRVQVSMLELGYQLKGGCTYIDDQHET